jgi:hypothetical protein
LSGVTAKRSKSPLGSKEGGGRVFEKKSRRPEICGGKFDGWKVEAQASIFKCAFNIFFGKEVPKKMMKITAQTVAFHNFKQHVTIFWKIPNFQKERMTKRVGGMKMDQWKLADTARPSCAKTEDSSIEQKQLEKKGSRGALYGPLRQCLRVTAHADDFLFYGENSK